MKSKTRIISIIIILVLFLNLLLPTLTVLAKESDSTAVITGTYKFSSNEENNIQKQNTFEYRDDCFTRSSFLGCKHLEILSIQASSASVSWYGETTDNYDIDPSQNAHNITKMLEDMKFKNVATNKYYTKEKHENSIGVAVGHKNIVQDGKNYTLLAIIPRSGGYKQEWAGNFIVGDGDIHEGFKLCRDEILRYVKKYIQENDINGDLKVWTTGWSRGAAVSNMIGGFFAGGGIEYFDGKVNISPEDVYCYTIATPKTIKNGLNKDIELSVSGNRTELEYTDDTQGNPFYSAKGGSVSNSDNIYNGIRSIISSDDVVTLVPPEKWGFTHYGNDISLNRELISEEKMLNELKDISTDLYSQYTENGKIKNFARKTFDLKTLSIVDSGSGTTIPSVFLKERMKGLENKVKTNKIYNDEHYQDALKSLAGIYGMISTFFKNSTSTDNINTSDIIETLTYTYFAYASEQLQKEGKAQNETEAIVLAVEDLISYFTDEEIENDTFTVDEFLKLLAKYLSDNENEPISDTTISGIVNMIPEQYKEFLDVFKQFDKNNKERDVTLEEGIKAFIKACYYGADPESQMGANEELQNPLKVRQVLYTIISLALPEDLSEITNLFYDENIQATGAGKFEDLIKIILNKVKNPKDEEKNIIKTYSKISELADDKIINILDILLQDPIEKSGNLYGQEYKNELQMQVNTLKQNITKARETISTLLFYTDKGFNTEKIIENVSTFVDNANLIPIAHYNEIYLAQVRTFNQYEDHFTEYKCIEGAGQTFNLIEDSKLLFIFNFDYDQFIEQGKIFVDNQEVSRDKYTISKGSTIITFNDDYVKTLSEGNHIITAQVNNGSTQTEFVINNLDNEKKDNEGKINIDDKTINPKTGDNIVIWIGLMLCSIGAIITFGVYILIRCRRKRKTLKQ